MDKKHATNRVPKILAAFRDGKAQCSEGESRSKSRDPRFQVDIHDHIASKVAALEGIELKNVLFP